jgi:hypothetical protein
MRGGMTLFQTGEPMSDADFDKGQHRPGRADKPIIHDWRLRDRDAAESVAAEIKWPQLSAFDSFIRERLAAILVRRAAERAAERDLSRDVRAKLWRARLEARRGEFAEALELEICEPFSLDVISRPPCFPEWWLKDHDGSRLCGPGDVEAGFDPDTATWLRDASGPAGVVIQPRYLDHAYALHVGEIDMVEYTRGLDVIALPPELGWISPKRQPLFWVPTRAAWLPLDD